MCRELKTVRTASDPPRAMLLSTNVPGAAESTGVITFVLITWTQVSNVPLFLLHSLINVISLGKSREFPVPDA